VPRFRRREWIRSWNGGPAAAAAGCRAGPWCGIKRHLMIVLREYGDCCSTRRPRRALEQAAPLRQLPGGITGLDQFRVRRRDRAGGVIHEYRLGA
jgi:hypothetical protein